MSITLRSLTVVNALIYLAAATYHTGVLDPSGALPGASPVEALLGLVLAAGAAGIVRSPRVAYGVALAGTLFGLGIVVARGLFGIHLAIHVVMLIGLAVGFALIFRDSGRPRST